MSRYQEMFGDSRQGRPSVEYQPVGVATGDPDITERARRRATRVLKAEHAMEFEELMREEAEYLQLQCESTGLPVGEGE